jgi:pyruvate dehydrogenase E2 component (dihydrolipoamide acetyltransferase)
MAIEIRMPALAPSIEEVTLVRWLRKVGDAVEAGEVIAEVETDKALVDLESTDAGIIDKLCIENGATGVKVGSVIAVLVMPGEAVQHSVPSQAMPVAAPTHSTATAAVAPATLAPIAVGAQLSLTGERVLASPLARRLAAEVALDLSTLPGTGPNGRIVRRDVEAARQTGLVTTPGGAAQGSGAAEYEDIPHSTMRRTIAKRMTESMQTVPHFYVTIDCELDALLDLRTKLNDAVPSGKISVNDFIIKAVAHAMSHVPAVNVSWTDTAIRRYRSVDISVAMATPNGLITPILRAVEFKSLTSISVGIKALAERAKAGKLLPQEYQGGNFTISNLGMYGVRDFSAIINPPQACILAVGAAEQRAVVKNGSLSIATVMSCTLSADHRVVDGTVSAEFLVAFKAAIQNPSSLMV